MALDTVSYHFCTRGQLQGYLIFQINDMSCILEYPKDLFQYSVETISSIVLHVKDQVTTNQDILSYHKSYHFVILILDQIA